MKNEQRHGCITSWLLLMIFANSLAAVVYLFAGEIISNISLNAISNSMLVLLVISSICNVFFTISLFKWKKWAFWGLVITSFGVFIINLSIGIGVVQSIFGLVGIVILYVLLQIKKNNVSSWSHLE
ncbi:MAG: hypothetical protein COA50_10785 [Flavobacteriaceae bacterium]|nr:MAG: hypothetical protein COA50_10785 [Flavobacteriaceae bacterium]